ncbi:conserved Plasmodium protein, unknown function [Plasmodium gallinaceum]|uniref:Fam-b protein n=1 Tax=Plasmodium gallinaceum TaxID=5849 RepID=A0A1J1GTB7_PLAGA|nr:conserved Plasmodium protein, unknown function [Plasmodium gallinaceum]CRG94542.1 conserved Plasmodium protein, unknown function [Plasmodium gallinaceum]
MLYKNNIFFLIYILLLNVNILYGEDTNSKILTNNTHNDSNENGEKYIKKLDSLNSDENSQTLEDENKKIDNFPIDSKNSNLKKIDENPTKKPTSLILLNCCLENLLSKNDKDPSTLENVNELNSASILNNENEVNDISNNSKEKKSIFSKIISFFKKEEKPKPKTLMEYIREKNKKIIELEVQREKKKVSRIVHKYLFYVTGLTLLYLIFSPVIFHVLKTSNYRKIILKQYKNNKGRKIVPYNYDFDENFMNYYGYKAKNYSEYYDPERIVPKFVFGFYNGTPYILVKLG